MPSVEKIDHGISVKIHRDVYADARALEGRLKCGRGINNLFRELIRREAQRGDAASISAEERLIRVEAMETQNQMMLEEILLLLRGGTGTNGGGDTPPNLTVA